MQGHLEQANNNETKPNEKIEDEWLAELVGREISVPLRECASAPQARKFPADKLKIANVKSIGFRHENIEILRESRIRTSQG